jgi:hypothetical protein
MLARPLSGCCFTLSDGVFQVVRSELFCGVGALFCGVVALFSAFSELEFAPKPISSLISSLWALAL